MRSCGSSRSACQGGGYWQLAERVRDVFENSDALADPARLARMTPARLGELIGQARKRYEYVVIDTPPLVPIPDARVVEVEIRLDDSATAAGMTNLQVEIAFDRPAR